MKYTIKISIKIELVKNSKTHIIKIDIKYVKCLINRVKKLVNNFRKKLDRNV